MPRRLTFLGRAFVIVLVGACIAPDKFLSIAAPAMMDSLVFVVNDPQPAVNTPIYGLSVVVCGTEQAMWTIAADGSRFLPARITYGRPVPGFTTQTGPFPLKSGCYEVFASGTRPLRFDVERGGEIHVRAER